MVLALGGCAPSASALKPTLAATDDGTIWFRTDEPRTLNGDLRFPSGPGPFPTVVLMHGCSGIVPRQMMGWQSDLRSWGFATFVVDSFRGRGISEVCTTGGLRSIERVADAYAALRIVATHPRIDRTRIALMGFSHGGLTALVSATDWATRTYVPPGGATFRAFFPFYPSCNARTQEPLKMIGPVRIHTGELDDWTPAGPCVERTRELRAAGADIDITVYPGAAHGFDSIGTAVQVRPNVRNGADCRPRLTSITGRVINEGDMKTCPKLGATVGWSPTATEAARANVKAQLAELLK